MSARRDYWDEIEAALTALPESYPLREQALASFDHLKERVLVNHRDLVAERDREIAAYEDGKK